MGEEKNHLIFLIVILLIRLTILGPFFREHCHYGKPFRENVKKGLYHEIIDNMCVSIDFISAYFALARLVPESYDIYHFNINTASG